MGVCVVLRVREEIPSTSHDHTATQQEINRNTRISVSGGVAGPPTRPRLWRLLPPLGAMSLARSLILSSPLAFTAGACSHCGTACAAAEPRKESGCCSVNAFDV